MGHKNPIKAHEIVRERVEAAIDAAAMEITDTLLPANAVGKDLIRVTVREILWKHANYGDVKNGAFTPEQEHELAELHEANAAIKETLGPPIPWHEGGHTNQTHDGDLDHSHSHSLDGEYMIYKGITYPRITHLAGK